MAKNVINMANFEETKKSNSFVDDICQLCGTHVSKDFSVIFKHRTMCLDCWRKRFPENERED